MDRESFKVLSPERDTQEGFTGSASRLSGCPYAIRPRVQRFHSMASRCRIL